MTLIEAIQKAAFLHQKIDMTLTRAIVKYVDETQLIARVVQYANESPEFIATLQAISESTFVLIPKINSVVVIGYINNSPNQAVILQYSEIDKIIFNTHSKCTITCNQSKFEVYPDYITLQSQNGNIMIADGVTIGEGSEPMVLGNALQQWAQSVDTALSAIIAWGAGVTPPLSGVVPPQWNSAILSQKNKVS
ncbi:MAG: hypothetical protein QHH74_10505 [Spirochaetota bacterium]|nr:hypothetical protein [Spirochaetota bacterium]